MKVDFRLYLIGANTTRSWRPLEQSLSAGLPAFQLREKDSTDRQRLTLGLKARALTRRHRAKLLINGRWDIAKLVKADGVHLPVDSLPIAVVRKALGIHALIGKSTHSLAEAQRAQREGADFITFGPIFSTASKWKFGPPLGLGALRAVCSKISIPVFALGGIKIGNARTVLGTGAWGIALISGIWNAKDPGNTTKKLLEVLRNRK
jgi:thiamine-phosphate pyrophosphorylase